MLENEIQRHVTAQLRLRRVLFCHVPNGSKAPPQYRAKLRALGLEAGAPDLLIFSGPDKERLQRPCALELKTEGGKLSTHQREFLDSLAKLGWSVRVAYGLDQALAFLREWGIVR